MKEILFTAAFGEETKEVRLLLTSDTAGGIHLYIDNYFRGQLFKRNGQWVGFFNGDNEFTAADLLELGDRIEAVWRGVSKKRFRNSITRCFNRTKP